MGPRSRRSSCLANQLSFAHHGRSPAQNSASPESASRFTHGMGRWAHGGVDMGPGEGRRIWRRRGIPQAPQPTAGSDPAGCHAVSPAVDGLLGQWDRCPLDDGRGPVPREVRLHLQGDESPGIILAPHGMVRKCYAFIYLPRNISSRSARVVPKKTAYCLIEGTRHRQPAGPCSADADVTGRGIRRVFLLLVGGRDWHSQRCGGELVAAQCSLLVAEQQAMSNRRWCRATVGDGRCATENARLTQDRQSRSAFHRQRVGWPGVAAAPTLSFALVAASGRSTGNPRENRTDLQASEPHPGWFPRGPQRPPRLGKGKRG